MKKSILIIVLFAVLSVAVVVAQGEAETSDDLSVYREPSRLLELTENLPDDLYLVDVRTPQEYESGHIPGAINRDYRELADDLPTEDREAAIIVYCRSGARAGEAERTLRDLGFTRVLNWGGIIAWPYEVVTGPQPR